MQENLQNIEKFFKYNFEIKKILYSTVPKEEYRYNKDALIEYSDKLFQALNDTEYYINVILEKFNFSNTDKTYFQNFIKALKDELIKSGYDFNKLKNFYNVFFANMSEQLVNSVGENCVGYAMFNGISLNEAKSINEILHVVHQTIINNQNVLQSLPKLEEKKNYENYEIVLYGKENIAARTLYESFPKELSCGDTDIVSLSNDRIIMMVRDRGHALSIEIEKENDRYYVRYFIPKICNVDMVNSLKGVNKVTKDSKYTVGVLETSLEKLPFEVVDFISKVPTDDHMFIEGGKFYEGESMQK